MKAMQILWKLANKAIRKGETSDAFFHETFVEKFTRMWEVPEGELYKIEDLIKKYSKILEEEK